MTYIRQINLSFSEALEKVKTTFMQQNFSVIVDIDVAEKIRNKTGNEFGNYQILGVCKPQYAYSFLSHDPSLWVYLPCSLTVYEKWDEVYVSALLPTSTPLWETGIVELNKLATEISDHLINTIESI